MIFNHKKKLTARLFINNVPLEVQCDSKFLGVILSSSLKWNKHIELVRNKISKNVGIVSKVRHLLPQDLARNLYLTLVNPYIIFCYCNLVWSSPEQSTVLNKIFKIQKKIRPLNYFFQILESTPDLYSSNCKFHPYMTHSSINYLSMYTDLLII